LRLRVPERVISDDTPESVWRVVVPRPAIFLERSPESRREPELETEPVREERVEDRVAASRIERLLAMEEELMTLPEIWVEPAPETAEERVPELRMRVPEELETPARRLDAPDVRVLDPLIVILLAILAVLETLPAM
jgi:hypothetical protein